MTHTKKDGLVRRWSEHRDRIESGEGKCAVPLIQLSDN